MSTLDYSTTISPAGSVPPALQAQWQSGLTLAGQGKIKERWDAIVGTAPLWTSAVADASNANWKGMVNPDFTSRSGRTPEVMIGLQLKKLTAAFTKAKTAHDNMFADSGALFIEAVNAKAGNWTTNVVNTLGLTGERFGGKRGPASVHVRLAAGDQTYLRDITGGVPPSGEVDPTREGVDEVSYIQAVLRQNFKAAFEGTLIQFGVLLLQGVVTDPTAMNTTLNRMLAGFLTTDTPAPPAQFINFEVSGGVVLHTHLDNGGVTPPP